MPVLIGIAKSSSKSQIKPRAERAADLEKYEKRRRNDDSASICDPFECEEMMKQSGLIKSVRKPNKFAGNAKDPRDQRIENSTREIIAGQKSLSPSEIADLTLLREENREFVDPTEKRCCNVFQTLMISIGIIIAIILFIGITFHTISAKKAENESERSTDAIKWYKRNSIATGAKFVNDLKIPFDKEIYEVMLQKGGQGHDQNSKNLRKLANQSNGRKYKFKTGFVSSLDEKMIFEKSKNYNSKFSCPKGFACKVRCFQPAVVSGHDAISENICRSSRVRKGGGIFRFEGEDVFILWGGVQKCGDVVCHH